MTRGAAKNKQKAKAHKATPTTIKMYLETYKSIVNIMEFPIL